MPLTFPAEERNWTIALPDKPFGTRWICPDTIVGETIETAGKKLPQSVQLTASSTSADAYNAFAQHLGGIIQIVQSYQKQLQLDVQSAQSSAGLWTMRIAVLRRRGQGCDMGLLKPRVVSPEQAIKEESFVGLLEIWVIGVLLFPESWIALYMALFVQLPEPVLSWGMVCCQCLYGLTGMLESSAALVFAVRRSWRLRMVVTKLYRPVSLVLLLAAVACLVAWHGVKGPGVLASGLLVTSAMGGVLVGNMRRVQVRR